MNDRHPIRNSIIASVVAGIILGEVWPPAKRFVGWLWSALTVGVTVPVWGLLAVAVAIVVGLAVVRRHWRAIGLNSPLSRIERITVAEAQVGQGSSPGGELTRGDAIEISGLERDVLRRIAKADGAPLYKDTVKRSLGTTNIRLQTVLDRLTALDLIEVFQEGEEEEDELVLFLTPRGRQYVLDNRLA